MIKLNRILLYVTDPHQSARFYEKLGFEIKEESDDFAIASLDSFLIHLHNQKVTHFPKDAKTKNKGAGVFIYIEVDDIEKFHQGLIAKGITPSSSPRDWPWGHIEFAIRDPNRYKIIIYQRKNE